MIPEPQRGDAVIAPTIGSAVTTSLALGWQMARLYNGPQSLNAEPELAEDLPSISELPAGSLVKLGLAQADAALGQLRAFLGTGVSLPTTEAVQAEIDRDAPDRSDAIRQAILDLHVALLVDLTAADYRLGKAYGLGRALADTSASARGEDGAQADALARQLEPQSALVLVGWLDDLKTVLPAHAGQAVAESLQRWVRWGEAVDLRSLDPKAAAEANRVLHRCSQRWRAVLSGEKEATDVLEIGDYVTAVQRALARAGEIARSLAWQLKGPLAVAVALIGVGVALMLADNGTAQVLAGVATVGGGLGITWRGASSSLGHVSLDLGKPLWGAEIDAVVANRLTPRPQRDYVAHARPKSRLLRAWHELTTADPEAPRPLR